MSSAAGFEFVDHPADVQVHSWGNTFGDALGQACLALFEVMMDPAGFSETQEYKVTAKGKDIQELVYSFLDEWLFTFDAHDFVVKSIKITKCDLEKFEVEAVAMGEEFDMERHESFRRTEVKAITYASMKVDIAPEKTEIYVIFDL